MKDTKNFIPRSFPRTKLPSGRVLTDTQQYQYDVLRSANGKLVYNRDGWWMELSPSHRERVYGLNSVAMWSLVTHGLVEAIEERVSETVFAAPSVAGKIVGPRYERVGQLVKEKAL